MNLNCQKGRGIKTKNMPEIYPGSQDMSKYERPANQQYSYPKTEKNVDPKRYDQKIEDLGEIDLVSMEQQAQKPENPYTPEHQNRLDDAKREFQSQLLKGNKVEAQNAAMQIFELDTHAQKPDYAAARKTFMETFPEEKGE
jgi:hypothetical protein